jgi:hypothetical protein
MVQFDGNYLDSYTIIEISFNLDDYSKCDNLIDLTSNISSNGTWSFWERSNCPEGNNPGNLISTDKLDIVRGEVVEIKIPNLSWFIIIL